MSKCAYCGSPDVENKVKVNTWGGAGRRDQDFYYCSAACRQEIESFSAYVNRNAPRFLVGITLALLTMIFGGVLFPNYALQLVGAASAFLGLLIIVFPFATPQTNRSMGIRGAVKTARVLGGATAAMGVGIVLLGLGVL